MVSHTKRSPLGALGCSPRLSRLALIWGTTLGMVAWGMTTPAWTQTLEQPAPAYPLAPPPAGIDPLPSQRETAEEQTLNPDYRISALQTDHEGNLWAASWQGVARLDPHTGRVLSVVDLPNTIVGALAQDKSHRLWVGSPL